MAWARFYLKREGFLGASKRGIWSLTEKGADKGIIMTTGTFTTEAKREARRDGAPPIELVDGEKLLDMFEKLELGLTPRMIFDVDEVFFDEFRK